MTTLPESVTSDNRAEVDNPQPEVTLTGGGVRIRRLLARFIGAGYLAFLVVTVAATARGAAPVAWWWTPAALMLAVVPGIALMVATFLPGPHPERWIRAAAVCAVVGFAAAAATWLPAWTGVHISETNSTWLVQFSGLTGLCAALVLRPVWVAAIQVATTAGSSAINQVAMISTQSLWSRIGTETVWALGFSGIFVAAVVMTVRTSHVLDAKEESVARTAADAAARAARERERTKFDALVHDRVIAVLLYAARTTTPHHVPAQARAALSALDDLTGANGSHELSSTETTERLRSAVVEIDASVPITITGISDPELPYPNDAVSAIVDASAEAVRNSIHHAGPAANTHLALSITANDIRVVITDLGHGFDPLKVRPGRLGMEHSITGRMNQIPGGRSTIVTGVGKGTSVRLHWTRPDSAFHAAPENADNRAEAPKHTYTAPPGEGITSIVGLASRWSILMAGLFMSCATVATITSIHAGMHPQAALGSLFLLASGITTVAVARSDPLGPHWTALCASTAPLQIVLATAGLSAPIADPIRNAAAISGGVVVCAFLCVRGRIGWAWVSQGTACAIYTWWVTEAGLGIAAASEILIPSIAVMTTATVFAAMLRPAAHEIYKLRTEQAAHTAERAAADAASTERRRQITRLDELARPALDKLIAHPTLSANDRQSLLLLEARLRDSVRARTLDTPELARAVWNARARGATVTLLDDGALTDLAPEIVAQLQDAVLTHIGAAQTGTAVTARIAPPRRIHAVTITITTPNGDSTRHEYDHTASPIGPKNPLTSNSDTEHL